MGKITVTFVDGVKESEDMSDEETAEMESPYKLAVGVIAEEKGKFVKSIEYELNDYVMTIKRKAKK